MQKVPNEATEATVHISKQHAVAANESVFLNKSVEWLIQWLTRKNSHLFHSWMNQCIWTNWFKGAIECIDTIF